ncbi:uncharacterized protein LOC131005220 [Salvia miltiorrhiza]|uniref:uncharacterized protein LOC131005220 n=1 Tax=Salvia miltiorrhiza TaxID=226208 RepID=UPI0025AC688C|nr:uncharacterized protein LOC131005220 [Salvia miltiorrhiza]XP_057788043.1 uncharacterized protein LOC131005220 [Salvia miltiorrhiza]
MDLETENRIAAILLKEAAELRREAQKEGALAYLREPTVRFRPNSRFLTATVRGVQQANRVVEVNEMWRLREKQLELDNKLGGIRSGSNSGRGHKDIRESHTSTSRASNEVENSANASLSSKKRSVEHFDPMEDEGLKDDEIDQFLQSRIKRGRGSVGSRMDETGPYLPLSPDSNNKFESDIEMSNKARVVLGPKKPYSLTSSESSSDDESRSHRRKTAKVASSKRHSRKHKSKEKSKGKSRRRKDKKSKHHK